MTNLIKSTKMNQNGIYGYLMHLVLLVNLFEGIAYKSVNLLLRETTYYQNSSNMSFGAYHMKL